MVFSVQLGSRNGAFTEFLPVVFLQNERIWFKFSTAPGQLSTEHTWKIPAPKANALKSRKVLKNKQTQGLIMKGFMKLQH